MRAARSRVAKPTRLPPHDVLRMPESGKLRIVTIADTHSAPHADSHRHIAALAPHAILHAGDIGALTVLDDFAKIAPLYAVRGNIDSHASDLPETRTLAITDDQGLLFSLLLHHIAVYGPKLRSEVAKVAHDAGASIVVCGHSHVPFIGKDKGLVVLNPGSIGPRRFHLPIVFAVIEVERAGIQLFHVDCETGARWEPR